MRGWSSMLRGAFRSSPVVVVVVPMIVVVVPVIMAVRVVIMGVPMVMGMRVPIFVVTTLGVIFTVGGEQHGHHHTYAIRGHMVEGSTNTHTESAPTHRPPRRKGSV